MSIYRGVRHPKKPRVYASLLKYINKKKAPPKKLGNSKEYLIQEGPLKDKILLLRTLSTLPFILKGEYGYYEKDKWIKLDVDINY